VKPGYRRVRKSAMRHHIRKPIIRTSLIAFFLLVAVAELSWLTPASARGGGANLMNSPGYQRALEESRKRYRESYSQHDTRQPAVAPRKKRRPHGHH
jgi:hypothetical protein